ncbi:hypothetical protein CRYUN_Cryun14cG0165500 [Craigia yunnanensis]
MALQNIGAGNSDDAFYRYKMPKMITKIEGRGNGIKTNIVNMVDIAKALARPASYTTKYFGYELGAQSKFDEKTGTSLVNGSHDTAKLAGLLENFIKKYVQCYGRGNPETEILEGEAADEEQKKLKKEGKKKGSSSKEGTSKVSSTKKKAGGSDDDHVSPPQSQVDEKEEVDEDEYDDVQWQTDTSLEEARQRIQEQLSAATADMVMLSTNESEKKTKVTNKAINKSNGTSSPWQGDHKAKNGNSDLHETHVEELKANLKKGVSANQLKFILESLSGSGREKMIALLEALFDGIEKGFAKEVVKKKNYLAAAVAQDEGSQLLLLKAIGSFCGKASSSSLKEVALFLKALYDADVLEEEYILQWYQEGLKGENKGSQVWKNAKPFIDWLQSAESESEEE